MLLLDLSMVHELRVTSFAFKYKQYLYQIGKHTSSLLVQVNVSCRPCYGEMHHITTSFLVAALASVLSDHFTS